MCEISRRWLGAGATLLISALLLSACEHGPQDTLRPEERARWEDRPDPTRDPGEARPVQPEARVGR